MRKHRRRKGRPGHRPDGGTSLSPATVAAAGGLAAAAVGLLGYLWMAAPPPLDPATLCPTEPDRTLPVTVLLVDPSSPLNAKHRTELRRLMREMGTPGTTAHVPVGGRIFGYHLPPVHEDLDEALKPVDEFCNPGGRPEDRDAVDDLTEGRLYAEHRWREFAERLEGLFPVEPNPDPGSPIIETIAVLSARHAHSSREEGARRLRLLIWSDLVQNSPFLTQYKPGWEKRSAKEWIEDPANAHLRTDMRGIDVSLFRLERPGHERFHTARHFKWWTELMLQLGATVRWQESIRCARAKGRTSSSPSPSSAGSARSRCGWPREAPRCG